MSSSGKTQGIKSQTDLSGKIHDQLKKCTEENLAEPAWKTLKKTEAGIQTWRIKDFKLEAIKKEENGHFYEGDSYIILHTFMKNTKPCYDAYIWIGNHSTADEYGVAAYKMAELDLLVLNDSAVQHREVQSNESEKFIDLFHKITISKGGFASGFKRGEKEKAKPRLLHISGLKKNVRVEEVTFQKNNLTEDDVYILDLGDKVYQINGKSCTKEEKFRGATVLNDIKSSRGKVTSEIIDDYTKETTHPVIDSMSTAGPSDLDKTVQTKLELSMWKLSDVSGKMEMSLVSKGKYSKSMLDSGDVYILTGEHTVFVWVGKQASRNEKLQALSYAQKYADTHGCSSIPLVKIFEGNETEELLSLFA